MALASRRLFTEAEIRDEEDASGVKEAQDAYVTWLCAKKERKDGKACWKAEHKEQIYCQTSLWRFRLKSECASNKGAVRSQAR
jgi:hypothetical protein